MRKIAAIILAVSLFACSTSKPVEEKKKPIVKYRLTGVDKDGKKIIFGTFN